MFWVTIRLGFHVRFASEVSLVYRALSSPFLVQERMTCRSFTLCNVPPKRSVTPVVFSASLVFPRVLRVFVGWPRHLRRVFFKRDIPFPWSGRLCNRYVCSLSSTTCLSPVYLPSRDCVNAPPIGDTANRHCTDYLVHRSLLGVTRTLFGSQRAHPQGIPVAIQTPEAINR